MDTILIILIFVTVYIIVKTIEILTYRRAIEEVYEKLKKDYILQLEERIDDLNDDVRDLREKVDDLRDLYVKLETIKLNIRDLEIKLKKIKQKINNENK